MKDIKYIGEHLWAADLGNAFIVFAIIGALLSGLFYFFAAQNEVENSWKTLAKNFFYLHAVSVFGIIGLIFYMLYNHYFEFTYVWQHSSRAMPMKYIFACFWEGQEGSFLLWIFWHVIIGLFLMHKSKQYAAPVMAVLALVQVFLVSMIIGVNIGEGESKLIIGTNPFSLLREHPDFMNFPFVQKADYLSKLDGRGLNPLLQNYWMTIHPPTLFFGFALTIVPFCFAIAGLWKKDFKGWQEIALPWSFIGVLVLGVGILMGGAWAYEALSFGGFWAWDPVENASLVPWIVLVGAAHVMLINKNRGTSLFSTHFLSVVSFVLILYSTFLTRSGVLGESSVHSFTDLGMMKQLLLFLLLFIAVACYLILPSKKERLIYGGLTLLLFVAVFAFSFAPSLMLFIWALVSLGAVVVGYIKSFGAELEDDHILSREFWLLVGSLVLFLSAIVITIYTSRPIFNKILGQTRAPFKIEDYNIWGGLFAVAVLILIGATQFLKYKKNKGQDFFKKLAYSFFISLALGGTCAIAMYSQSIGKSSGWQVVQIVINSCLIFVSIFAVLSNTQYWLLVLNGKIKSAGASIAHIGFALVLLGATISTSMKQTLSKNTSRANVESLGKDFKNNKSLMLKQGDTLQMANYFVSYRGKQKDGINIKYKVEYYSLNENKKLEKVFELFPQIQMNQRMGNSAEPDTRHFWNKDIYTHVTYADLSLANDNVDTSKYEEPVNNVIHIGDTIFTSRSFAVLEKITSNQTQDDYNKKDSIDIIANLKVYDIDTKTYEAKPIFQLRGSNSSTKEAIVNELGLKFSFWKINPDDESMEILVSEKKSLKADFIVMEAYMFPYINILWLGCFIMAIGTFIAVVYRVKNLRKKKHGEPGV